MEADFERSLRPLWLKGRDGDEAAYRQALGMLAGRLRAYFRRRMAALPDDVEDLVQETLLALHLQRATYDPSLPVSAWAHAIARHKLVDLWRRRGRQPPEVALDDPAHPLEALDGLEASEPEAQSTRRDLDVLLQSLPAAQRDAILMIKVAGLSVAEASARSGVSVSALKVQVHRGLKRLAALVRKAP
jgi:RNA polymerase sigma-70 factor, ECF subfamily